MDNKLQKNHPDLRHWLAAPFIYFQFFAIVLTHISMEIYHQIAFRLYGLPLVKMSEHIKIDRHKLKYLNLFDRFNCAYCGYANGFLSYASEIAARTEKYWCGIKHKKYKNYKEPTYHNDFLEYGDKEAFENKYGKG